MKPRIKICCISSKEEAKMAIDFGASAIGLAGKMHNGPGTIPDGLIRQIAFSIPPPVATVLLTGETSLTQIIDHHHLTNTNTIQIIDSITKETYCQLKAALPSVKIIQVINVSDERSVAKAIEISEIADAILLNSGNSHSTIKESKGNGRVHNWKLSRMIRDNCKCPVFLGGDFNPENVRLAIDIVDPFGIDVCSGVRTGGKLDKHKLEKFFKEALHD
jgi:phosphoribosylanthranilate isomerase